MLSDSSLEEGFFFWDAFDLVFDWRRERSELISMERVCLSDLGDEVFDWSRVFSELMSIDRVCLNDDVFDLRCERS